MQVIFYLHTDIHSYELYSAAYRGTRFSSTNPSDLRRRVYTILRTSCISRSLLLWIFFCEKIRVQKVAMYSNLSGYSDRNCLRKYLQSKYIFNDKISIITRNWFFKSWQIWKSDHLFLYMNFWVATDFLFERRLETVATVVTHSARQQWKLDVCRSARSTVFADTFLPGPIKHQVFVSDPKRSQLRCTYELVIRPRKGMRI